MPGANSREDINYFAAVNRLVITYQSIQSQIATLAGLAAGATDPQIQALNTAMPATTADLSATFATFLTQQKLD